MSTPNTACPEGPAVASSAVTRPAPRASTTWRRVNVAVFLARLNELAWVSIYSDGLTDEDLDILGVARAASLQAALDAAFQRQGPDAQVLVMTHGGELCPVLRPRRHRCSAMHLTAGRKPVRGEG